MRSASNSAVNDIEVEVDRALDRARKQNIVRTNPATTTVSGSGSTGTVVTNTSSGDWFLENVTTSALGASIGVVTVKVDVANSDGEIISSGITEANAGSEIDFGGHIVKAGWSIDYTVEQSDSSSYDVTILPIIRKPNPAEPKTVEETPVIDSFEDSGLGEYSGDTGNFSVTGTASYHLDSSLEYSNAANSHIFSTSGLDNYPAKGDTFSWYSTASSLSQSADATAGMTFGVADSNNWYHARVNYDDSKLFFIEEDGGSTIIHNESSLGSGFEASRWDKCTLEWGDTVRFHVTSSDDNSTMASVQMPFTSFNNLRSEGGVGFRASVENSETVRFDKAVVE